MLAVLLLGAMAVGCGEADQQIVSSGRSGPELPPSDVITALAGSIIAPPVPVTGSDRLEHLAYEVLLTNALGVIVTVEKLETLNGNTGAVINTLEGDALPDRLTIFGSGPGVTFGPGQTGVAVLDATATRPETVPRSLVHRLTVSLESEPGVPFPNPDDVIATTFELGRVKVSKDKPIVIEPPLRGEHWYDGDGCCVRHGHRGAVQPINGQLFVAERYAIDYVQLDDEGKLFDGPVNELSSYAYFGAPIYAVADGEVVNILDGLPEQIPGQPATGVTGATAGGNYIVQDIGGGNFAFYAHLQAGSLRFKLGDHIRAGQVIGLLGNSGNSDAPHLHFHVMDGPAPLGSNGRPYEFTRYRGEGVVRNADELLTGGVADLDTSTQTGQFRKTLPLDGQLMTFPQ